MGFPSKITCFGASQLPRCGDTQAHMVRNHDLPTSPWLRSRPTIRFPLTDASGTVWVQPQKNLNQNHPVKLLLDSGPRESVWDNVCSTLLNFGCNLAHANRYTPGASQVAPVVRTHRPVLEIQQTWVRSLGQEDPLKKEMAVFLPRKFQGQRNLAGYSPWRCKQSDKMKDE